MYAVKCNSIVVKMRYIRKNQNAPANSRFQIPAINESRSLYWLSVETIAPLPIPIGSYLTGLKKCLTYRFFRLQKILIE